ncbi:MAG: TIGR03546 family protein [Calditrichaceae bacterium]|nr:TIGR03546 family protein [Calditrichia bacterium]NUQ40027.1 TIGR03546 family protein [Calditrichaceae bacterium]
MFFLNIFSKILKILRSNESPNQIAGGFILGMIMGMAPFWSLFGVFLVLILIIFNLNIASALLAYAVFSMVVFLADPLIHQLGYWLLAEVQWLKPLWTYLYHAPLVPYTSFNNTVYIGSIVVSLLLAVPVFIAVKKFVVNYREKYEERVKNWKWIKWIKASKVYELYERISALTQ